jgi:hypothetical protein
MTDDRRREESHSHLIEFPEALEAFFSRIDELKAMLGPAAAPGVDAVAETLREGLAARDRGDVPTAVTRVAEAMDRLATLAAGADPAEGAMMRAVAEHFRGALGRGAVGEAREAAEQMRERSGGVLHPRRRN